MDHARRPLDMRDLMTAKPQPKIAVLSAIFLDSLAACGEKEEA